MVTVAKPPREARKGKIAKLPFAIREEVCRRLRDGEGQEMLPWLNDLPDTKRIMAERFKGEPITPQNLSEWRAGGYHDWLDDQEEVERIERLAEFADKMARASGGELGEKAISIATGRILQILEGATGDEAQAIAESIVGMRFTEIEAKKIKQKDRQLDQKDRDQELDRELLEIRACTLFIKWMTDRRATDIAQSRQSNDEKIRNLRALMFGKKIPSE